MSFVLDSCFSAQSVEANDFKPGPMGSRGLGQLAYDKRIRILAASQSDEVAHEYDYLQHGLLTYVLTHEGWRKAKRTGSRWTRGSWWANGLIMQLTRCQSLCRTARRDPLRRLPETGLETIQRTRLSRFLQSSISQR